MLAYKRHSFSFLRIFFKILIIYIYIYIYN